MSYEHLVAGTLGGLTSTLILHPLDLLKVRFAVADGQPSLKKNYRNISNALVTIVKEEGFRGLYKGVTPNCLGAGTAWGLYFLFYNSVKDQMLETSQYPLGPLKHMFAGICAGALTTAITNPIWVVKTRLCLQYGNVEATTAIGKSTKSSSSSPPLLPESKRYSGTWDAFKKVYKHEGVHGLYRGFVPGLLGVSHGAIQLTVYEKMKRSYLIKYDLPDDHTLGSIQYLSFAAMSKLFAASLTYPVQVVRARLQDQHVSYEGFFDVIRKTWRYETHVGFYKGFRAYLLHVTPNICIVFFIYESVTSALK